MATPYYSIHTGAEVDAAVTLIMLSSTTGGEGSPEGAVDGNEHRQYYDKTEGRWYRKTTPAGTLTGWE